MANIRRIEGKTGVSYKITVTSGRDLDGKQIRHFMTWNPPKGMTERQRAKEVQEIAFKFEEQIENGFAVDNRQTFAQYAEYFLQQKARDSKKRTVEWYRDALPRINESIGYMKLNKIRPQHLNEMYAKLEKDGIRSAPGKATPKTDIAAILKGKKLSLAEVSRRCGVPESTLRAAVQGKTVSTRTADKLSEAIGQKTESLFTVQMDTSPLAGRTVHGYHRVVSAILGQAAKEMLIPYNPASKATPPKKEKSSADSYQMEELHRILECLDQAPIKWRTITYLLITTGCRRGEIAGLKWDAIDWKNNQIKIGRALLYTSKLGIFEDTTKEEDYRVLKLPKETMQLLKLYRAHYDGLKVKNGDQWIESGYVFTRDDGGVMNPCNITKWLNTFSQKNNLPPIHPHKFRHTAASVLIANGTDIVTVKEQLGHSQASTTTDIYSHAIAEAKARASECIADALLRRA